MKIIDVLNIMDDDATVGFDSIDPKNHCVNIFKVSDAKDINIKDAECKSIEVVVETKESIINSLKESDMSCSYILLKF